MLNESLRPIPKKDVDYKNMPLQPTPEEYYLLSRVDGKATVGELCAISSMGQEKTITALKRLEEAGLIEFPGAFGSTRVEGAPAPPEAMRQTGPQASVSPQRQAVSSTDTRTAQTKSVETRPTQTRPVETPSTEAKPPEAKPSDKGRYALFPVSMEAYPYDRALLNDEDIELDEPTRRELEFVYAHLDQVDYYQLLGLKRDAKRKEVRSAFFTMSKRFHPDLFYGKALKGYQPMVDAVFLRVNKAQQILSHKKKRAEYDQHLGPQQAQGSSQRAAAAQASSPQTQANTQHQQSASSAAPKPEALSPADAKKREMAFLVLVRRGEKHEMANDLVEAAAEYKKAFAIKHDATVALRGANLLLRSGHEHYEQAILLAMAAYKEDRSNLAPLMLIGDAYEEIGRLDDAVRYYDKILAIEPQHKGALQRKKYVQAQQG